MKKTILSLILAIVAMNINAQIAVDERGHVAIGHTTPSTNLDMTRTGVPGDSGEVCINFYSKNPSNKNLALRCRAVGGTNYACAIAGLVDSVSYTTNKAAIYGAISNTNPYFAYSGSYAGYFNGSARVTSSLYSNAYLTSSGNIYYSYDSMTPISDILSALKDESEKRVTDKLGTVQAVQVQRHLPSRDGTDDSETEALREGEDSNEEKLSPIQYGLNPEQLKEAFPELVYEDKDGNISINYVEMVPLLVQSINELSQELAELKGTSNRKAKKKAEATSIDETTAEVDMVRMDQNKPNPFSESTVITLNIPKNSQKANIFIYDMSGKQVKAIPVDDRGETNITVFSSDLTAGMYIYTLVVDGKVKVTRKMIVSEV